MNGALSPSANNLSSLSSIGGHVNGGAGITSAPSTPSSPCVGGYSKKSLGSDRGKNLSLELFQICGPHDS